MLNIHFKKTKDTINSIDRYFNFNYEDEWFDDPLVKEMVLDVDKSVVENPYCIKSPVLGQIPPTKLSGGVKALIVMLKTDEEVWATSCGDNCAKWIIEISKIKDLTIVLEHYMKFPEYFDAIDLETGFEIKNITQFRRCAYNAFRASEDETLRIPV